jgi:hypothetical protein
MAATTAVVAGTATAVSGHVARKQDAKAQQAAEAQAYEQQQMAPPPMAPAPAPAPAPAAGGLSPDAINELQQLAALHEQGILTDDEFNAQKAKILGA